MAQNQSNKSTVELLAQIASIHEMNSTKLMQTSDNSDDGTDNDKMSIDYILNHNNSYNSQKMNRMLTRNSMSAYPSPVIPSSSLAHDQNTQQWNDRTERALILAASSITGNTDAAVHLAMQHFNLCIEKDVISKESPQSEIAVYLAACLAVAYREVNIQFSFRTISSVFGIPKQDLVKAYKNTDSIIPIKNLTSTESSMSVTSMIERLATSLQFSQELIAAANKVARNSMQILEGRNLKSIAAVSVYMTGVWAGVPNLSRKDVATISGVSDVTLWSLSKILKENQRLVFERN